MTSYIVRDIDPALWQAVKARAAADGRSLRWLILRALALYAANGLEPLESAERSRVRWEEPKRPADLPAVERSIGE